MPESELIQEQLSNEAELSRYCRRCLRKLKVEKWQQLGYGPVCAKKTILLEIPECPAH